MTRSKAAKKSWTPERMAKHVERMRAHPATWAPEARAAASARTKQYLAEHPYEMLLRKGNPKARARASAASKKYYEDPETRQLMSDNFWKQDLETRNRMLAAMNAKKRRQS